MVCFLIHSFLFVFVGSSLPMAWPMDFEFHPTFDSTVFERCHNQCPLGTRSKSATATFGWPFTINMHGKWNLLDLGLAHAMGPAPNSLSVLPEWGARAASTWTENQTHHPDMIPHRHWLPCNLWVVNPRGPRHCFPPFSQSLDFHHLPRVKNLLLSG